MSVDVGHTIREKLLFLATKDTAIGHLLTPQHHCNGTNLEQEKGRKEGLI